VGTFAGMDGVCSWLSDSAVWRSGGTDTGSWRSCSSGADRGRDARSIPNGERTGCVELGLQRCRHLQLCSQLAHRSTFQSKNGAGWETLYCTVPLSTYLFCNGHAFLCSLLPFTPLSLLATLHLTSCRVVSSCCLSYALLEQLEQDWLQSQEAPSPSRLSKSEHSSTRRGTRHSSR
jgi:hypothetical protein